MPSSGGSVSDAPVNKVVDGQRHYLAYITPDEGKSLQQQGGKEVVTDQGIPAYPGHHGVSEVRQVLNRVVKHKIVGNIMEM